MEPTDLTLEVLRSIRDEVRKTNERVDHMSTRVDHMSQQLNTRVEQTNLNLDSLREELSHRIVESEIRTSTAITDLAKAVHEVANLLRSANELRPRVEKCEQDIAQLKQRLPDA